MTTNYAMRVFKVSNTSQTIQTVVAADVEAAKKISVKTGHARKETSIRAVVDVTDDLLGRYNMSSILKTGRTGYIVSQRISGLEHGSNFSKPENCRMFTPTATEMRFRLVKVAP